jgi:parallel beta-helix repeat protein
MSFSRLAVTVVISSVLFAGTAGARTLYVANGGNDANLGTLVSAPLATIKRASALAQPGDVVHVRGGVYLGAFSIQAKGTSSARITFQPHPGETVVFDGTGTVNTDLVTLYRAEYVDFRGFEIRNSTRIGLTVYESKNVGIYDNDVHHSVRHGVYVGAASFGISSDVTVDGNRLHENVTENQFFALGGSGWAQALGIFKSSRIRVTNNRSYQNWGEGFGTALSNDVLIENNTVYDNFSVGIYLDNARTTTVNRNLVYTTGDTRFYREGSPASGIAVANEDYDESLPSRGNVFSNNIVVNSKYGFYYGAYQNGGGMVDTKVVNNTFHKATAAMLWIDDDTHTNSMVANNIFSQVGGQMTIVGGSGVSYDHNLWYGGDAGTAEGSGDVVGNPLFVNAGGFSAADYKLQPLSPAVHSASASAAADDYFGAVRTAAADMGAHELSLPVGNSSHAQTEPEPVDTPVDTESPSAPSALRFSSVTSSSVSLVWFAATDNVAVRGYAIYQDGLLMDTVAAAPAYTVTGLEAGRTYNFHVVAVDAQRNESAPSNLVTVTTSQTAKRRSAR